MAELTCTECGLDFEAPFTYGEDVECPGCGVLLETDTEYDEDGMYCWVVGPAGGDE